MAEQSFPFENIDTTESQFSQWARNFQSTGIKGTPVGTELKVSAAGTDLNISVASGQSFVRGHYYINTASKTLAVTSAGVNTRIDIVVVELDPVANTIITKIVEGTAVSSSPVAPTLTQTDTGTYQLPIAVITIPNSTIAITNEMIADVRTFMSHDIGLWTTSTRPANPIENQTLGFNTDLDQHEFWNGTDWVEFTPTDAVRVTDYTTTGDILVASAANTPTRLAIGAANQVLKSNGTSAVWADSPSALKTFAVGGDISSTLNNTSGYHVIDNFHAQNGLIYLNGTQFTADSTTIKHQYLPANATIEYYQNWTSNVPTGIATYWIASDSTSIGTNKYVSTNGTTWSGAPTGTTYQIDSWRSYDYINGLFIGGSMQNNYINGPSYIYTSTDNITWTTRVNGTVSYGAPYRPVLGNGLIVMPFGYYNGMTSTDGITWTGRTINPNGAQYLLALTYGAAGGWVSHSNFNAVGTSTDGITWTARTFTISTQAVNGSAYGNGVYVAVGNTGTIASSTAPTTTWTARTSNFGTSNINAVAYGAGIFVAVGAGGRITTSTDGTTWTAQVSNTTTALNDVRFVNSRFMASNLGGSVLAVSTNGTTWTVTNSSFTAGYGAITYVGSTYYNYNSATFSASTDGITWGSQSNFVSQVGTKGNGLFVVSNAKDINVSNDGIYWIIGYSGFANHSYSAMTYDATHKYLAVSQYSTQYYVYGSTNGITWTTRYSNASVSIGPARGIASNGTTAVTGFQNGTSAQGLLASTDGFTWILQSVVGNVYSVAYGNGTFVAKINSNAYTSTNGTTWTDRGAFPSSSEGITFANGLFIAGTLQTMYVSTDGITWKRRYTPGAGENPVSTSTYFNGKLYVASYAGNTALSIKWTTSASDELLVSNFGEPIALV